MKKEFTTTEVMVLQEQTLKEVRVIGEQFSYIKQKLEKLDKIEEDVSVLKEDMKLVKLSLQNKVNTEDHVKLTNRVMVLEKKVC